MCLRWGATHLPLAPRLGRRAEEAVQDGDVAAEERRFLLHDVLLEEGGHLVPKQSLVVLPDLPLHLHRAHFVQLLVRHHDLQLLLGHLRQEARPRGEGGSGTPTPSAGVNGRKRDEGTPSVRG